MFKLQNYNFLNFAIESKFVINGKCFWFSRMGSMIPLRIRKNKFSDIKANKASKKQNIST